MYEQKCGANVPILLVVSATTLENTLAISYKDKHILSIYPDI